MQIQSYLNYSTPKPNFKAVYPVVHWTKEGGSRAIAELSLDKAGTLNENIVRRLNMKPLVIEQKIDTLLQKIFELKEKIKTARTEKEKISKENKLEELKKKIADLRLTQRVQAYISRNDTTYANNPVVRGFYDKDAGYRKGNYNAIAYIATGEDALYLESLGRGIGKERKKGSKIGEELARKKYWEKGIAYVKKQAELFKMKNSNDCAELHVKMNPLRNKANDIESFDIVDMKFFPLKGANNPFMTSEWIDK